LNKALGTAFRILVVAILACAALVWAQSQPSSENPKKPPIKIRASPGVVQGLVLKTVVPDATDLKSVKDSDVKVVFEIGQNGKVDSAKGVEGNPMLFERSITAIRGWEFRPYLLNGEPIYVESYITFHFNKGKVSVKFQR
jgi:Gram-negative bacterial TonB protein C-terminal